MGFERSDMALLLPIVIGQAACYVKVIIAAFLFTNLSQVINYHPVKNNPR